MNESSRMELAVKYFTNHRWIFSGIGVLIGIIAIFLPTGYTYFHIGSIPYTQYEKLFLFGLTEYFSSNPQQLVFNWFRFNHIESDFNIDVSLYIAIVAIISTILVLLGLIGSSYGTVKLYISRKQTNAPNPRFFLISGIITGFGVLVHTLGYTGLYGSYPPASYGLILLLGASVILILSNNLSFNRKLGTILQLGSFTALSFVVAVFVKISVFLAQTPSQEVIDYYFPRFLVQGLLLMIILFLTYLSGRILKKRENYHSPLFLGALAFFIGAYNTAFEVLHTVDFDLEIFWLNFIDMALLWTLSIPVILFCILGTSLVVLGFLSLKR